MAFSNFPPHIQPWEKESLEFGQCIHQGTFSEVRCMKSKTKEQLYAVKIACNEKISQRQIELYVNDLKLMRETLHYNIIHALTSLSDGPQIYIVMNLMHYQSCTDIVRERFPYGISEQAMGLILRDVLNALIYLHNRRIIHTTVKGSRILINKHGSAVLSGFKYAVVVPEGSDRVHQFNLIDVTNCLNWISPEIVAQDLSGFTYTTDVYSLGITILELCNGEVPFSEMSPAAMLVQKTKYPSPQLWDKRNLPLKDVTSDSNGPQPGSSHQAQGDINVGTVSSTERDQTYVNREFSKPFKAFVGLCLVQDHVARPTIAHMKQHRFMRCYNNVDASKLLEVLQLDEPIQFQPETGQMSYPPTPQFSTPEAFHWNFNLEDYLSE